MESHYIMDLDHKLCRHLTKKGWPKKVISGFSLTPYLESFTPIFGLRTPVFQRISSNLHSGTPTFSKICLWDSCFQNPSENPESVKVVICGKYKNLNKITKN